MIRCSFTLGKLLKGLERKMKFKGLTTIAAKARFGLLIVALLTIVSGVFIYSGATFTSGHLKTFQQKTSKLNTEVLLLQRDFYNYDDQMNMAVLVAATEPKQAALVSSTFQQAFAARSLFHAELNTAISLTTDPKLLMSLSRIKNDINSYDQFASQGYSATQANNLSRAVYIQTLGNIGPSNDIMPALVDANNESIALASAAITQMVNRQTSEVTLVVGGILLTVLLLVALMFGFKKAVSNPLSELSNALRELASGDGDLRVRLDDSGKDEVGVIAGHFNTFKDKISDMINSLANSVSTVRSQATDMKDIANSIGASAEETSAQSGSVSAITESMSASVGSVSAATEEMRISIHEIARNASQAAEVAGGAVKLAGTATGTIERLGASSGEIGEVIKTITSIAEQTNLLALNATIEAARAGEAGKGFAVVASEVKELAKDTAKATEDISRKIQAIQTDTKAAVDAISEISAVIAHINDLESAIASAVEEQSATTNEIGRISQEAARGASEIAETVPEVARAASETARGASRASLAAQDLEKLSESLSELASQFKTDESGKSSKVVKGSQDPNRRFGVKHELAKTKEVLGR